LTLTRAKGHEVTIELLSGRMVAGLLKSYDTYVLLVEADGSECLVYKHAISTMGLL
jgi:host factor-I protein